MFDWKRDEALDRETLRERLDREDMTVRGVLADEIARLAMLALSPPVFARAREPFSVELRTLDALI